MKKLTLQSILSQAEMVEEFHSLIITQGKKYKKFKPTLIRPGIVGELIETIVESGLETTKVVTAGEFVVQALTNAKEQYVITKEKFETRYELSYLTIPPGFSSEFKLYNPTGEIMGLLAQEVMDHSEAWFIAPWGEKMRVLPKDILAVPLGLSPEIYRIAWEEFQQTYK